MGILGSILSFIPTVASVVGQLFAGKTNDYVKYSFPHINRDDGDDNNGDIYFEKGKDDRIIIHNGCRFPIHVSLDATDTHVNDMHLPECSTADITDMLVNHSLNYVDKLRISTNGAALSSNGDTVTAISCSGKIDKDIQGPAQIGEYVSIHLLDDDLIVIVHSDCKLIEISSLNIKGEGNEPERIYENITYESIIPVIENDDDTPESIVFKGAVAPYCHSQNLLVTISMHVNINAPSKIKSNNLFEGEDWEFLKKGRCLNA